MSHLLKVRIGRVVCRNRESLSEYDHFALSGAVIVDGVIHPFDMEDVAVNERIAAVYANPVIFDGFADGRDIGLVLYGIDIDNNDRWVANRKDIGNASETIAGFVEWVPVIGEYAAKVLKNWPKVVDVFVELDEHDVLLNHSQVVTLPEVSALLGKTSRHDITIRFQRSDPTGYSDWDYSLPISFEYQNLDVPSFGHVANETSRPRAGSQPSEWLGSWVSGRVHCHIAMSETALAAFDVTITETVDGVTSTVDTIGVGISRVYLESIVAPIDEGLEFTRAVIERGTGTGARVLEPFDPATLRLSARVTGGGLGSSGRGAPESDVAGVAGRLGGGEGTDLGGSLGTSVEGVASRGERIRGQLVTRPPEREQTGADFLQLNNDAVLEIFEVLRDGEPSEGRWLRYVRPASPGLRASTTVVEEWLRPRVV